MGSSNDLFGGAGVLKTVVLTTSQTWIPPAALLAKNPIVQAIVIGGGGGGGAGTTNGSNQGGAGSGGSAGRVVKRTISVTAAGIAVTIGAAGAAGSGQASNGTDGGNTSFGPIVAPGGRHGTGQPAYTSSSGYGGRGSAGAPGDTGVYLGNFAGLIKAGGPGIDGYATGGDGGPWVNANQYTPVALTNYGDGGHGGYAAYYYWGPGLAGVQGAVILYWYE